MTLTARQSAIVAFIRTHVADHGYPPTVRDIAAARVARGEPVIAPGVRVVLDTSEAAA
jgi:SOS-response transcriptional repressor LexA